VTEPAQTHVDRGSTEPELSAADTIPVLPVMLVGCAAATAVATTLTAQIYLSMLSHGHSLPRMLAWQIIGWCFWGLVAPLVLRVGAGFTGPLRSNVRQVALAIALGLVLIVVHVLVKAALMVLLQPLDPVSIYTIAAAIYGELQSAVATDLIVYVLSLLAGNLLGARRLQRHHEQRESRLQVELARAQLHALRLEIQPHFLFNTLNSVAALIRLKENGRALEMEIGLSDLMRTTVDGPTDHLVALSTEIDFVKRYIDLQRTRFADRLEVDYQIGDDCRAVSVPTFLLQPLVENALRHGASPQAQRCHVQIGAKHEGRRLRLWVRDDGVGLPPAFDLARDAGTGLSNTHSRLRQIYGAGASFEIRAGEVAGTIVEMMFPVTSTLPRAVPAT
jgi:sensor histidine kinase YesM